MILILTNAGWGGEIANRLTAAGNPAVNTNLYHAASAIWQMRRTLTGVVLMTSDEDSFARPIHRLGKLILRCRQVKKVFICYHQKWLLNGTLEAFGHHVTTKHMMVSMPIGNACISSIAAVMTPLRSS